MTISSSLNAGVAGLASNASRLATISDNIANSATFGYKRVETDFEAMVMSSTGGTYSAGGVRVTTQRLIDRSRPPIGFGDSFEQVNDDGVRLADRNVAGFNRKFHVYPISNLSIVSICLGPPLGL